MRLVVHGAKGPTTAEFIYTSSAVVQKSQEAFEALDAVSAHARAKGDGTGLILCTTLEQQVRGVGVRVKDVPVRVGKRNDDQTRCKYHSYDHTI